ncbi:MAG: PmoA family protein [Thermoguttaceae bacterium]|nr:PmoA family protein [Thermoguttaceae bacterium]
MKRIFQIVFLAGMVLAGIWCADLSAAEVKFEKNEGAVKVLIDGMHFTTYNFSYGMKPIFWPVYAPNGNGLTRDYPMKDPNPKRFPFDSYDHIHQRSVWFTHGSVNGYDFWHEQPSRTSGLIEHQEFTKFEAPSFTSVNLWKVRPTNQILLTEERTCTFGADTHGRWMDLELKLIASHGDVKFGDTKEGTMGVRVPGVLEVNKKQGGKITNAEGLTNDAAWGKQSPWVDYSGIINGKNCGVAIMNHPTSERFPTYWHVRTYGLFAANPFGVRDFTGGKIQDGSLTVKNGESVTFKYRLYFHDGNTEEAEVAKNYESYAK